MSDQPKPDETEPGSNDGEPTFSRRAFLGVGGIGLISATGLAFAQRNGTNATDNGGEGRQNGSQPSSGADANGSKNNETENDQNKKGESENDKGNDKNENGERNDTGESGDKTDKNEVKPGQVSLSTGQARTAATKRVNGTVQSVDLGNQNGTPAYEVTVKTSGGSTKEVAINANNGNVLKVGAED